MFSLFAFQPVLISLSSLAALTAFLLHLEQLPAAFGKWQVEIRRHPSVNSGCIPKKANS
jgi:hypothetical protein